MDSLRVNLRMKECCLDIAFRSASLCWTQPGAQLRMSQSASWRWPTVKTLQCGCVPTWKVLLQSPIQSTLLQCTQELGMNKTVHQLGQWWAKSDNCPTWWPMATERPICSSKKKAWHSMISAISMEGPFLSSMAILRSLRRREAHLSHAVTSSHCALSWTNRSRTHICATMSDHSFKEIGKRWLSLLRYEQAIENVKLRFQADECELLSLFLTVN